MRAIDRRSPAWQQLERGQRVQIKPARNRQPNTGLVSAQRKLQIRSRHSVDRSAVKSMPRKNVLRRDDNVALDLRWRIGVGSPRKILAG